MRCLALAEQLQHQGAHILFLCQALEGHMAAVIEQWGFQVRLLDCVDWSQDAQQSVLALTRMGCIDWLIVDHYALDQRWHQALRTAVRKLMVIDDLANRALLCDVVLNQNMAVLEAPYETLVSPDCGLMLGAQYALIRPEFRRIRPQALEKRQGDPVIKRILVSLGGMDPDNVTGAVLVALSQIPWQTPPVIDVVLNAASTHLHGLRAQAQAHPLTVTIHTSARMSELMLHADLAIGAAGSTAWERCCLGLPTVAIQLADNQAVIIQALTQLGAHLAIVAEAQTLVEDIAEQVASLQTTPTRLRQLGRQAASICDGFGAVWVALLMDPVLARDAQAVMFIPATMAHAELILRWQSYPETRRYALNPTVPDRQTHFQWMQRKLVEPGAYFWLIQHAGVAVGIVRLDQRPDQASYLLSIFVIPAKYRLGIASAALQIVKRLRLGADIYAQVMLDNQASMALFKRAGFTHIEPDLLVWREPATT